MRRDEQDVLMAAARTRRAARCKEEAPSLQRKPWITDNAAMSIKRLSATRYVLPLREGGSLPAIVDTEDGQYVLKFRGAGQGPKALVAELIAAGIAQACGLPVPDPAVIDLEEGFGLNEPDPEIQDLLRASVGANFGLRYLPGAFGYEPAVDRDSINTVAAAGIVWFDALITNVDRTAHNPNLLFWDQRVWLIDHGASLYFHHAGGDWSNRSQDRFPLIRQHILLQEAGDLRVADADLRPKLTEEVLTAIVHAIPDEWLDEDAGVLRRAYVTYFLDRLNGERGWLEEAERARRG